VMARVNEVGSTLSKVLTGVGALAMLIGGVVIMSLMLIAVSERRKEIGVRRSVGASRQDIMTQFLLEAATIAALGGLVGVAIGAGGTSLTLWSQQLPPTLVWRAIGTAVLVSVAVGLVFGLHPAWKASNVDPIAALRS
jgi:putative ABC transport system permease protein